MRCQHHSRLHVDLLPPFIYFLLPAGPYSPHPVYFEITTNEQGNPPDIRADERATRLLAAHNLSIVEMIKVLYPTLYSIHDLPPDVGDEPPPSPSRANAEQPNGYVDPQTGEERAYRAGGVPRPGVDVPVGLPPTSEKLSSQGVFLLDSGEDLLMYVGRGTSAEVLQELFGVATLPDGEKSS